MAGKSWLVFFVICIAGGLPIGKAGAQTYPSKPVRFIVPFPPGSGVDILARLIGQKLSERWGQSVVIENRAGAGGSLGAGIAAKAPADGYTVLVGNAGTQALNPSLYSKLAYDPVRDFAPVTLMASVPQLMVIHPSLPVRSVRDFIALAKARPGQLNYGSAGIGSAGHLSGELLKSIAGIDIVHVPYKGNQQALTDLIVGQVQMTFGNLLSMLPHAKAGRVRGLAVTSAKRSAAAPDLPTMIESGVPGYEVTQWFALFVPANTSAAVVTELNKSAVEALKSHEVRTRLTREGADVIGSSPGELGAYMNGEIERWSKVIRAAKIGAQ